MTTVSNTSKVLFGIILVLVALGLAIWHERTMSLAYEIYSDGPGRFTEINPLMIDPTNEQKPVWFKGKLIAEDKLIDKQLGVVSNALRMKRSVLILQWLEKVASVDEKLPDGSNTKRQTYSYYIDWSEQYFAPLDFKVPDESRQNPKPLFSKAEWNSSSLKVGAIKVPSVKSEKFVSLPVTEALLNKFPAEWAPLVKVKDGRFYVGLGSPEKPAVGDVLVSYEVVPMGEEVTVIGRQSGNTIEVYPTLHHGPIGKTVLGNKTLLELFAPMESGFGALAWGIRIAWVAVLFAGLFFVVTNVTAILKKITSRSFEWRVAFYGSACIADALLAVYWYPLTLQWIWMWFIPLAIVVIDVLYHSRRYAKKLHKISVMEGLGRAIKKSTRRANQDITVAASPENPDKV